DDAGERALQSLKDGKAAEAERLFAEVLETEAKAAAERKAKAAQAAKHLAAFAKPKDVVKAAEYYRRATELDPEDAQAWDDYARVVLDAGRTTEARTAFEQAALRAQDGTELAYRAMLGLGDVTAAQGNLPSARQLYERAAAMAEPIAKADPGNAGWQRDLSGSQERIGNVLRAQGKLAAALQSYKADLAIMERLAKADPGNAQGQRDPAITNTRIGDVHDSQKETPQAIEAFQRALAIYRELMLRNPDDVQVRLFSVVPLWRIGVLKRKQGRNELQEALAILKPLAAADRLDANRRD